MYLRKNWRPPITVFVIALAAVGFYLMQTQTPKAPITSITPVTPERVAKSQPKPPPGETASESGHFHADGTFHATAHTPAEQVPVAPTDAEGIWRDGVWYPENYTHADIAADLAGEGAATDEEYHRRAIKYAVNVYIQKHLQAYPDCTEYPAIIDDAKRYAVWKLADHDYWDKYYKNLEEENKFVEEMSRFMEKYGDTLSYGKEISLSEIHKMADEANAHEKTIRAQMEQADALAREKPIEPKPKHTH